MGNEQDGSQLSQRIRARLRELGWTQKRLAREMDVADSSISDLLNGKVVLTAEMAVKLASVPELKFTREDLMAWGGVWAMDVADSSISDLLNGKVVLTAEMAVKLASVPELKFTREDLMAWGGVWAETRPSRKRDVALALFDQLNPAEQDLTIDFMVMIAQRERERSKK